tara:strand:- start:1118 stop:1309 length:192 start_codon:yes stop_codon:yes gene_type:complete
MKSKPSTVEVPLLAGDRYFFELPNGEFILIDLTANASRNGDWVLAHRDKANKTVDQILIPQKP